MIGLYNAALLPLRPLAELWALWCGRDPARRTECAERMARRLPPPAPGGVWLHGASLGETRLVASLAQALRAAEPERPLALSAVTATGRAQLPAPPAVQAAFFAPLDFRGFHARLLRALQPAALALLETELWPNLLTEAAACGVPVVLLNARLAPERMGRYRRWARLYRPLIGGLARIGAQSEEDATRFRELGAAPTRIDVTGNIKYDLSPPAVDRETLRARFGLSPERPVVVAGSTAAGEEPAVLEAFAAMRGAHGDPLLILAPRHTSRVGEVEQLLRERGLRACRLSQASAAAVAGVDVLLVDTVGELAGLYALAWVAFVGGSLVPIGGHNLLEPAAFAVPVLFGPHTHHVVDAARELERCGGGRRVADAKELADETLRLIGEPDARRRTGEEARGVLARNRGALGRSVALLQGVLAAGPVPVAGAGEGA